MKQIKKNFVIILLFIISFSTNLLAEEKLKEYNFGKIIKDNAPIYSEIMPLDEHPDYNKESKIIYRANKGETFKIIHMVEGKKNRSYPQKKHYEWYQVILPKEGTGWIHKEYFRKSKFKLVETSKGKFPDDNEVILNIPGIVINQNTKIYTEPDIKSDIIDSLSIGAVFFVQDILKKYKKKHYHNEWFQIVLQDNKLGWMNIQDFQKATILAKIVNDSINFSFPIDDKKQELVSVLAKKNIKKNNKIQQFYQIGKLVAEGYDGYMIQEKKWVNSDDIQFVKDINVFYSTGDKSVLDNLWEKAKKNDSFDKDYNNYFYGLSKKKILEKFSNISLNKKKFEQAIEYQKKIMEFYPDSSSPYEMIGFIYSHYLKEYEKALDYYQQILTNIQEKKLLRGEHFTTEHLEAVLKIKKIISNSSFNKRFILEQYRKVKKYSKSPVGYMIATLERVKIFKQDKRFEIAIKELESCLEKYPSVTYSISKDTINYSFWILKSLFEIYLYEYHSPEQALKFCDEIRRNNLDQLLVASTFFLKAKTLDETNGNRKVVIDSYKYFIKEKDNFKSRKFNYLKYKAGYKNKLIILAENRIKQISLFKIKDGFIQDENLSIFESPDFFSEIIYYSKHNEKIAVLYPIEKNKQTWYKIKTSENIIGWIQEKNIELENRSLFLQPIDTNQWYMTNGDQLQTRSINGSSISKPQLKGYFKNVSSNEIIYWDVNEDNFPDLVVVGFYNYKNDSFGDVVVIDGKTQKIIRRIETGEKFNNPLNYINEGILYCLSKREYGKFITVDLNKEELINNTKNHTDYIKYIFQNNKIERGYQDVYYPKDFPVPFVSDNILYSINKSNKNLFCYDISKKEITWSKRYAYCNNYLTKYKNILIASTQTETSAHIYGIRTENGKKRWSYRIKENSYCWEISLKDSIICGFTEKSLFAINANSGKEIWYKKFRNSWISSLAIANNTLYVSNKNIISAYELETGKKVWDFRIDLVAGFTSLSTTGSLISVIGKEDNKHTLFLIGESDDPEQSIQIIPDDEIVEKKIEKKIEKETTLLQDEKEEQKGRSVNIQKYKNFNEFINNNIREIIISLALISIFLFVSIIVL